MKARNDEFSMNPTAKPRDLSPDYLTLTSPPVDQWPVWTDPDHHHRPEHTHLIFANFQSNRPTKACDEKKKHLLFANFQSGGRAKPCHEQPKQALLLLLYATFPPSSRPRISSLAYQSSHRPSGTHGGTPCPHAVRNAADTPSTSLFPSNCTAVVAAHPLSVMRRAPPPVSLINPLSSMNLTTRVGGMLLPSSSDPTRK